MKITYIDYDYEHCIFAKHEVDCTICQHPDFTDYWMCNEYCQHCKTASSISVSKESEVK